MSGRKERKERESGRNEVTYRGKKEGRKRERDGGRKGRRDGEGGRGMIIASWWVSEG